MNARGLHSFDAADGAGELAFERAQMIDVLNEARGAKGVGFVEDLVADAAALGQAGFGELHAEPGDLVFGYHDDGPVVLELISDRLSLRSLMIEALSSTDRSVNNGTICGVVIWIIRNEKKPIRASVTAAIAAIRAAPSDFTKSKKPCTGLPTPQGREARASPGKICPV